jgi:deoxyadenosine/deoxycytidine kinase
MRGIDYEQTMGMSYLEKLAETYTRFFHGYNNSALLIVNAEQIDWVHNS